MINHRVPSLTGAAAAFRVVRRLRASAGAPLRRTVAVSAVLVLVLLGLLDLAYRSRFGDLHSFYEGVTAWWRGLDPYGQLPGTYAGGTPGFIYPPFALLPLSVFAALPFPVAAVLSVLISVACLAFTCFAVLRAVWPQGGARGCLHGTVVVMPLLLLLEPVRNTIGQGQVNLWLMALVAADCLVKHPKWPRGLLIGLAAAIKITPAAFVLFLVVRKDFRAAAVASITATLSSVLMFACAPAESARFWFGGVLSAPAAIVNRDNQSIAAGLNRLGLPDGWHQATWLALLALTLLISVVIMRRTSAAWAMLTNAAAALLVSPLSWSAHWVWLAPALLAFAAAVLPASAGRSELVRKQGFRTIIACTALLLIGPQILTPAEGPWTGWQHVLVNTYPLLALTFLVAGAGYRRTVADIQALRYLGQRKPAIVGSSV
ncbi:glycosyltransferase family 87 protein [Amycolatopsis minnesotensis]|uniref:Glycosyltransferase 87 family protein n=1 Tax=Amycolatopsis minnesotensis TaxID=337894 RepID=A0ABP5CRB9_9PSEU